MCEAVVLGTGKVPSLFRILVIKGDPVEALAQEFLGMEFGQWPGNQLLHRSR